MIFLISFSSILTLNYEVLGDFNYEVLEALSS